MEETMAQRRPDRFLAAMISFFVLSMTAFLVLVFTLDSTTPEFSAAVSGYGGLVRSAGAGAAPPTFRVALRVKNNGGWRHCFDVRGGAVVEYDGVPLAFSDLDGFCVPPRSVVEVPVVAAGEGLGMPDKLYESLQGRRERQEGVPLEVRLTLVEKDTVKDLQYMLLRCTAMLDGRPDSPSRCLLFFFVEPGRMDGE